MDLTKRLELDDSLLKSVTKVLEDSRLKKEQEIKKPLKEETLEEFRQTAVSTTDATPGNIPLNPTRARSALGTGARLARRAVGAVGGVATDILLNPSETDNNDAEMQRRNSEWNTMSPEQRQQYRRDNNIPEPEAQPNSVTQPTQEPTRPASNETLPTPPVQVTPPPQNNTPRSSEADNSADRLNAISLGQTVAARGGTPEPDATPRNDSEQNAANNMRRRRREIANEETKPVGLKRRKNKKLVNPEIDFNPETVDVKEAVVTKGKIKSSKRISKVLQDIMTKNQAKDYKFEDGTSVKIEPAMARIALNKYNAMSDFDKAQAAKKMRNSYKEFLTSIR